MELVSKEVRDNRDYFIVKSNELIEQNRYEIRKSENNKSLGVMEQKIFLYLVSKIKPDQDVFEWCELDINKFCSVMKIKNSRGYIDDVRNAVEKLASKVMWLKDNEKNSERLVRYIDDAEILKNTSTIRLKLDDNLRPYLLNLTKNFSKYRLNEIIPFKCKYSFLILDLILAYGWKDKIVDFEIEDLKERLDAKSYNISNFKKLVIDKALMEINRNTVYNIQVSYIKRQRTIIAIRFYINVKQALDEIYIPMVIDLGEIRE